MTDEKQDALDADAWLDDVGGGETAGTGEIDQASIDELLGGSENTAGGGEESAPAEAGGGSVEIDQASLDALLNEDDSPDVDDFFAAEPEEAAGEAASLDQSSIDALFGSDDADFQAALDDSSNVPSQADIDELFAQAQEHEEPMAPAEEDVDLNELFAEGTESGMAGGGSYGSDADRTDPAFGVTPAAANGMDAGEEDIFGGATLLETPAAPPPKGKPWRRLVPVHLVAGASRRALWGGLVAVVLLLGGGGFMAWRDPRPAALVEPLPRETPLPLAEAAPAAINTPPEARGVEYQMPEAGGEVPLLLAAKDQEGDTLAYEITTPPQHGRLAGELPTPIYLPNKDFPGEDVIEYRVSDGKAFSQPAIVVIAGPDLRPPEEAAAAAFSPKVIAPRRMVDQAPDVTLKTLSTRELVIDWGKIWQQANSGPFSEEMRVEIIDSDLHGKLTALDPHKHRYCPDRLFSGSESISYRFRRGETVSKAAELRLLIEPGDFPPEIRFGSTPAASYLVGETVVLDASPTMDDDPAALSFSWRQVAGTPVKLEQLNDKGSMVSFVVPSSFYTEEDPGPVLQLTATDRSGQQTEKMVKIAARSRRHSALWRGAALDGRLIDTAPRGGSSSALRPALATR